MKTDSSSGRLGRGHQLADGIKDSPELGIVFLFKRIEFSGQIFVRRENLPEPDEGPHNLNVDSNSTPAVQDAGKHGHTLLGEGTRKVSATTSSV